MITRLGTCAPFSLPPQLRDILHELQRVVHRISRQHDRDRVQAFFYDVTGIATPAIEPA